MPKMDFFSSSCKTDFQSVYKPTVSGWIEGGQNTGRMKMKMKTTFFFPSSVQTKDQWNKNLPKHLFLFSFASKN